MSTVFNLINETVRGNALWEVRNLPLLRYKLEIKELRRSNNQNALYWQWVGIIAKEKGFDKDDLHHELKRHFIGEAEVIGIFGEVYKRPKSSADLTKAEFSVFMDKVAAYAHSESIKLPQPDYYGYEDMKNRVYD